MAEGLAIALAKGVVGKLGKILAQQVFDEASLLLNFQEDFESLQRELAYISEDIVDECAVEPLYTRPIQSCVCCFSQLDFRHKMGKTIKDLKDRMSSTIQKAQEINLVRQVLNSSQPSSCTSQIRRKGSKPDSQAVAVEHKVEEIVRLLGDPAVKVIAIVGMGGLGKTFLLQHVYDRTKHGYEYSAWISVSQSFSLRTLQCNLELVSDLISEKLEGRTCLIVLDDLWKSSLEGDLVQCVGLPTGINSQCKILVTTRNRDVAANMRAHVYEMQRLSEEDSWNLFCLFAFSDCEGNRSPEHLERLAHQIAEKCGRLSLAVKTVAASMLSSSDLGV
ncbi:hypothetical protein SUGI_0365780 [Cryptomeria japonica]|nr:hypothetical protein SUGI_0365780 [Cryptomeria japonica]